MFIFNQYIFVGTSDPDTLDNNCNAYDMFVLPMNNLSSTIYKIEELSFNFKTWEYSNDKATANLYNTV